MASTMVAMLLHMVVVMVADMVEVVTEGTEEEGVMEGMEAMEEEDMMGTGAMADKAEVEVSQLRRVISVNRRSWRTKGGELESCSVCSSLFQFWSPVAQLVLR